MIFRQRYGVGLAILLAAGVCAPALADPPARVARLAYGSGSVSLAPAGDAGWRPAEVNRPLLAGDRVWAAAGARDEIQIGNVVLRMDGDTLLTLVDSSDRVTQLQLPQGRLDLQVRRLDGGEVLEIGTPNLALSIRAAGHYRLAVDADGMATTVLVRSGWAAASGAGRVYTIGPGQSYRFAGPGLLEVQPLAPEEDDDFGRWVAARERRVEQSRSARYVAPGLVGYADLDDGGVWRTVPGYGAVWQPVRVGPDWAPYRDGHWEWLEPWGWTWIDAAPWGYAVSHYGRWAYLRDGWCWVPGPRAARPVYAPALVVFVDAGGGHEGRDHTAWIPLAPREVYRPPYRASRSYVTNINISNTYIEKRRLTRLPGQAPAASYANRQARNAVVAVPTTTFVHAEPVAPAALALPAAALRVPLVRAVPAAAPAGAGVNERAGQRPLAAAPARPGPARMAPAQPAIHAPIPPARAGKALEPQSLPAPVDVHPLRPAPPALLARPPAPPVAKAPVARPERLPAPVPRHPAVVPPRESAVAPPRQAAPAARTPHVPVPPAPHVAGPAQHHATPEAPPHAVAPPAGARHPHEEKAPRREREGKHD